jgi:hypothetical protein
MLVRFRRSHRASILDCVDGLSLLVSCWAVQG